jgi:hypothetical protein
MGGVWFLPSAPPIVWRSPFPLAIQRALVTSTNRSGAISISDLELAGTLAHKQILVQELPDIAERPIWLGGDNQASLAWASKGSATACTARAYLLRLGALHQRHHRYVPQHDYVPGVVNAMADDASRLWHLSDATLLAHFDSSYPQASLWQLRTLHADMSSALTGALSRQRSIPATLHIESPRPLPPGTSGNGSVSAWASAPISKMSPVIPCQSYSFSLTNT